MLQKGEHYTNKTNLVTKKNKLYLLWYFDSQSQINTARDNISSEHREIYRRSKYIITNYFSSGASVTIQEL